MRSFLVAAALVTVVSSAHATSSLSFEAEGYLLDMVVGDDSRPIVSGLNIAMPGSQQATSIPMRLVKIEIFDTRQKILLLGFQNPGDATLPEGFRLTVKNDAGTLRIGGKSLRGNFSWGM
jgi:hypothetical protein